MKEKIAKNTHGVGGCLLEVFSAAALMALFITIGARVSGYAMPEWWRVVEWTSVACLASLVLAGIALGVLAWWISKIGDTG